MADTLSDTFNYSSRIKQVNIDWLNLFQMNPGKRGRFFFIPWMSIDIHLALKSGVPSAQNVKKQDPTQQNIYKMSNKCHILIILMSRKYLKKISRKYSFWPKVQICIRYLKKISIKYLLQIFCRFHMQTKCFNCYRALLVYIPKVSTTFHQ